MCLIKHFLQNQLNIYLEHVMVDPCVDSKDDGLRGEKSQTSSRYMMRI